MICRCEDCGLLFQNPRPSLGYLATERNRLYEDAIEKPHGHEIKDQAEIARIIMKGYHHRNSGRPAVLNAFGKHVLDVNCGLGLRLREFQKYGWDIHGIDPILTNFRDRHLQVAGNGEQPSSPVAGIQCDNDNRIGAITPAPRTSTVNAQQQDVDPFVFQRHGHGRKVE